MKKIFAPIVFCIICSNLVGQQINKEVLYSKYHHFIIEVNKLQTQKYADSVDQKDNAQWKVLAAKLNLEEKENLPPPPPQTAVFERKTIVHFIVTPENYVQYRMNLSGSNGSLAANEAYYSLKIDRKTLMGSSFDLETFQLFDESLDFSKNPYNAYEIISIDKEDTKEFCGHECYKVVMVKKDMPFRILELYVTESIHLDYNPAFNDRFFLDKFFPLYVKNFIKGAPNDAYTEYIFHEKH